MSGRGNSGKFAGKPGRKKTIATTHSAKSEEIKRSLVRRARIRKNYFKELEKQEKRGNNEEETGKADKSDNQDSSIEKSEGNTSTINTANNEQSKHKRVKPLTYQEKLEKIAKRKEAERLEYINKKRQKLELVRQNEKKRQMLKEKFSKKTDKGQPLMGPRINALLDKIKSNKDLYKST